MENNDLLDYQKDTRSSFSISVYLVSSLFKVSYAHVL